MEVQDSIKAIIVPEAAVKEQELEPSFIGKYPMTFYFETGEFEMKAAFTPFLKTLVMDANANPEYHILISGYADRYGNPEFNKSLSVQRAESFKKALISYGINVESIIVTGLGSQDASAKTDPQLDRRVEIEIFRLER